MGFELPLALLGLLAAAIPLIVHRMRKRELPRVVLPTFALLARAAAQSQRKRTLQDLLLLVLRIAVIALAAFAIAAPFVAARIPFGDGRTAALVLVLDDSLSMARVDRGSSLFERARERAALVMGTLPSGSEVAVVLGGKPARVLYPLGSDLAAAGKRLSDAPEIATRADDMNTGLTLASRELSRSQLPVRRMLVLSDFARHVAIDPGALDLDDVEVAVERIGYAATGGNAFIASANAAPDPTQPQKTSVAVEVRAQGNVPERARLELVRAGSTVAKADIVIKSGGARAVLHVPTPDEADDPRAQVKLVIDDALDADDEAGIVLTRADSLRVLLVNGDPHPASDADELRYASRALSLLPDTLLSLSTRTIDPASLPHARLASYDAVLLANVPAPDAATAAQLLEFVQKGGGLIVTAGHRVDAAAYDAVLSEVLAAHVSGPANVASLHFASPNPQFLPEGMSGLREAETTRRLTIEPTAQSLLQFEDGAPAIAARDIGDGRSILFATTIDADSTDLPLRPGYLPLLVSLIREAAGSAGPARSHVAPGETIELPVAKRAAALEVTTPDGKAQKVTPERDARTLHWSDTAGIGAYRVRSIARDDSSQLTPRGAFVVRAPLEESDLTPASKLPGPPKASVHAHGSLVHRPLASIFFLLAGLLVLIEGFARVRQRVRA